MAKYVDHQSVYNATLSEYQDKGFRLIEVGHELNLYYQDELVDHLSLYATPDSVRRICAQWLMKVGMN